MEVFKLNKMTRGWFVGDFDPSLYKADFEVAVKRYKKGDIDPLHCHKYSKEFTTIISGSARVNDILLKKDDIIRIDENEYANFECLSKCVTVVVRTKSIKGDKYCD